MGWGTRWRRSNGVLIVAFSLAATACGGGEDLPVAKPRSDTELAVGETNDSASDNITSPAPPTAVADPELRTAPEGAVLIDAASTGAAIDRRVFGTNLPAWAGPELLADQSFRRSTIESGVSLLRMPGGSWSNLYDWLGCEQADDELCYWTWAARPTDFIGFLRATDLAGMWTVSINETAQKAAAAVAFFNAEVDDATVIGIDRDGVDWGTAGLWATLRAEHGNPEPVGIELWEVGNEVFGGQPETGGAECASFGWEEVWTCDGTEYLEGIDDHDGALAIREAMLAVDPDIEVGLVGTAEPTNWNNFGNEVIDGAGEAMDFYIVHFYGYDKGPDGDDALQRPRQLWPDVISSARGDLAADVPIAMTEYNLVSNEVNDPDRTMTQTMNALFLADTLGQFVIAGVPIANQWNLANGTTTGSGTDYGLISVEDGTHFPAYDAMAAWGRTGSTLLSLSGTLANDIRIYPTRHVDGRLTLVVLNLGSSPQTETLFVDGLDPDADPTVTQEALTTDDLTATEWKPPTIADLELVDGALELEIAPWSIGIVEIAAAT